MPIGPMMNRCATCGQEWWDSHCCPKQTPPMTVDGFFAEAKRLNLRMLGTPEETRAALDLKDAEIERLRSALRLIHGQGGGDFASDIHEARAIARDALGPNARLTAPDTAHRSNDE